jgi:flavodoxin
MASHKTRTAPVAEHIRPKTEDAAECKRDECPETEDLKAGLCPAHFGTHPHLRDADPEAPKAAPDPKVVYP